MNKHVVAISVLGVALVFLADRCAKLEKRCLKIQHRLAEEKIKSSMYEICLEICSDIIGDDTDEKKEA